MPSAASPFRHRGRLAYTKLALRSGQRRLAVPPQEPSSLGPLRFVLVLVVASPPRVGFWLRPTGRRLLPRLLAAERGKIEERPDAPERLHTAASRKVAAIHVRAVAEKHTEPERLALFACHAEVGVEVAAFR